MILTETYYKDLINSLTQNLLLLANTIYEHDIDIEHESEGENGLDITCADLFLSGNLALLNNHENEFEQDLFNYVFLFNTEKIILKRLSK